MMDVTGTTRLFGSASDVVTKVQADLLGQLHLEEVAGVGNQSSRRKTRARYRTFSTARCPCRMDRYLQRSFCRTELMRWMVSYGWSVFMQGRIWLCRNTALALTMASKCRDA
jgi:hypothetical protein